MKLISVALTTVAVGGVLTGSATAAEAASATLPAPPIENITISLPSSRGNMTFYDDGDQFTVCDTKADGYQVEGTVRNNQDLRMLTVVDGGEAGCQTGGYDVLWRDPVKMTLTWLGGGGTVYSRTFSE